MGLLKTGGNKKAKWKIFLRGGTVAAVACSMAITLGGCDAFNQYFNLPNSFLDPSQVGRFDKDTPWGIGQKKEVDWPILDSLGVLDEPDSDWTNATDPIPADLVSKAEEQTLQPGDGVRVSIFELLQPGTEAVTETRIDDLGNLSIKNLGKVQATGLTPSQLETKIGQTLIDQQILPPNPAPQVNVLLLDSRSRVYYLMGAAARPGTYTIQGNDFRLLEALVLAGDIPVQSGMDYLYIIRQIPYDDKGGAAQAGGAGTAPSTMGTNGQGPNPLDALRQIEGNSSQPSTVPTSVPASAPGQPSARGPVFLGPLPVSLMVAGGVGGGQASQPQPRDLDAALGMPQAASTVPTTIASTVPAMPAITEPGMAPMSAPATRTGATTMQGNQVSMWNGNGWVVVPAAVATTTSQSAPATDTMAAAGEPATQTRVIRIPIKELREGVSKYNIVIRPGDIINVPILDLGEFYLEGNIGRPGVYSLTGRKITLKQAVAAGGNLGPLAVPRRCELIRRIGPDREEIVQVNLQKIFDCTEPDIFLKANDVLNIGTDAIEPFFAVARNAYRASYGWGFIYDKNFNTSTASGGG